MGEEKSMKLSNRDTEEAAQWIREAKKSKQRVEAKQ